MEIIKVLWGDDEVNIDVTSTFIELLEKTGSVWATKTIFGDPTPFKTKSLKIKYTKNGVEKNEIVREISTFSKDRLKAIENLSKETGITQPEFYEYLQTLDNNTDYFEDHLLAIVLNHTTKEAAIVTKPSEYAGFYCYIGYYMKGIKFVINTVNYKLANIFTFDAFTLYKDNQTEDVYKLLFKNVNNLFDSSDRSILENYFHPSDKVLETMEYLKIKYEINVDKCLGVYYRGTDKCKEAILPSPILFVNKAKKLKFERIIVQTDQQEVADLFREHFGGKCIFIKELPMSSGNLSVHHHQKENRIKNTIELNSVLRILSECNDIIINPNSSVSQYIINLRKKEWYIQ